MRDIHVKVDDDLFERWQKCAEHYGRRSYIMRRLLRKAIEELEKDIFSEKTPSQQKPS